MIHCEAKGSDRLERAAVWLREVLSEQHHDGRCVHHHAAPDLPWGSAGGRDASVGPPRDDRRVAAPQFHECSVKPLIFPFSGLGVCRTKHGGGCL